MKLVYIFIPRSDRQEGQQCNSMKTQVCLKGRKSVNAELKVFEKLVSTMTLHHITRQIIQKPT